MHNTNTAAAARFVACPACGQILNGGWVAVYCYCTKWVPTSLQDIPEGKGMGPLLAPNEVVRLTEMGSVRAQAV